MVKLATLLNHINEGKATPVTILSSKSNIQLTAAQLLETWTNDDIKKHFEYTSTRYDIIQFTTVGGLVFSRFAPNGEGVGFDSYTS